MLLTRRGGDRSLSSEEIIQHLRKGTTHSATLGGIWHGFFRKGTILISQVLVFIL